MRPPSLHRPRPHPAALAPALLLLPAALTAQAPAAARVISSMVVPPTTVLEGITALVVQPGVAASLVEPRSPWRTASVLRGSVTTASNAPAALQVRLAGPEPRAVAALVDGVPVALDQATWTTVALPAAGGRRAVVVRYLVAGTPPLRPGSTVALPLTYRLAPR